MDEWVKAVRDLGFPVFIACYLLFRLDRTLSHLMDHLDRLEAMLSHTIRRGNSLPPADRRS